MFELGKRCVELAQVVLFICQTHVANEIAKGKALSDFDDTLDFIHRINAQPLFGIGERNRKPAGPPPVKVRKEGQMNRIQAHAVIREPLSDITDVIRFAIIEMLSGGENLDLMDFGAVNLIQNMRGESLIDEQIRGKSNFHQ